MEASVTESLGETFNIEPEASPVEEHQSNGAIERAVWDVGGTARTLKATVEDRHGYHLPSDVHVVALYTLFAIGADGRT